MTKQVRVVLVFTISLAMMAVASCGHYNCSNDDGLSFSGGSCSAPASTTSGSGSSGSGSGGSGSGGSGSGGSGSGGSGNAGATVYGFLINPAGAIGNYTFDQSAGTLQTTPNYVAPTIPANSGGAGMVVAQGKFLYAAFADLGEIYGWSIGNDGNLTALSGLPLSVSFTIPQVVYNQYVVITNPAGTLLFISDNGLSQILVYQINSSGSLTPAPGSPFTTTGIAPLNLGMDGLGKYLYVSPGSSDHDALSVAAYSVSSAGVLQPVPGSPFNYPLWQMQGDPSGQFLVGISGEVAGIAGADDDHIYAFSIGSTGAITPVTNSPFSTKYPPYTMVMQPTTTGEPFIYTFSQENAFNTGANPLEGFQLSSTGALTELSDSPFDGINSGQYGQFDQGGAYLFFYIALNGNAGLTTFQVSSDGALTLGPDIPLAGLGYWAVADVP